MQVVAESVRAGPPFLVDWLCERLETGPRRLGAAR